MIGINENGINTTLVEPINYEERVRKLSRGLRLSGEFITHTCSHHNLSVTHIETLKQRIGVKIEVKKVSGLGISELDSRFKFTKDEA